MAYCIICGSTYPEEFTDTRNDFCDRCKDIMDYWFKEALNDITTTSFAMNGNRVDEKRFAEIVENYGNLRWREEYERSKNREKR